METIITETATAGALTALFRRGEVYADSWPREVRRQLNVEDPLAQVVAEALDAGQHVVITGNAGDGKSHLLATALDLCKPRGETDADGRAPRELTAADRVFIRDAATIDDQSILRWTDAALGQGAQLVITLNEGPLTSLAKGERGSTFYEVLRRVAHARAAGSDMPDPTGVLLLNLAGRQLVQTGFVSQALQRLLPAVEPCRTCGTDLACPRTAGRDLLAAAPFAAERITTLLRLLGQSGLRLTARELWVFLADLFFGWQCPPRAKDVDQLPGWWWSRIFDPRTALGQIIAREFDPIHSAQATVDNHLWLGDAPRASMLQNMPILDPRNLHRRDPGAALRAFESAKRAWFFLAPELDVQTMIDRQSHIPGYVQLLEDAEYEPARVVQRIVAKINRYRIQVPDAKRLHLSRHHRLAAHRRPTLLAASDAIGSSALFLRLPYLHEGHGVGQAGFKPARLELAWGAEKSAALSIDYQIWRQLHQPRTVHSDRQQEALDMALDLFLSQAPVGTDPDPEIIAKDHSNGSTVKLTVRGGRRPMFEVTE